MLQSPQALKPMNSQHLFSQTLPGYELILPFWFATIECQGSEDMLKASKNKLKKLGI